VRGLPEVFGELPAACLAEEIDTPGEGRIRGLVTVAGNPVLSTPNAARLRGALAKLDFMVSVDIYLNETTRHANVVLPAPSALSRSHFDLIFYGLSVRNVVNYSPALFPRAEGELDEWEVLLKLVGVASGMGPNADVDALDDFLIAQVSARGRHAQARRRGPRPRRADRRARRPPRSGSRARLPLAERPYGDAFGRAKAAQPRRPRAPPARRRSRSARATHPRRAPHAERQDRARAAARSSPTSRASRRPAATARRARARRPPHAALEQLVDAQPRRAREGRPTCTLHVTPTTRAASGSPTERRRACARAWAPWSSRSR
jgi:hypothetical protein